MAIPKAIDLFSGAGGATLGVRNAGFKVVAAVEADPHAAATYRANHPDIRLLQEDIRSVDPEMLRKELKLPPGELTLLKACPPCQGYSSIGVRDADDTRNDLVAEVWRFTRVFKPRIVMIENVPGLASDYRLSRLVRQLRSVGYGVKEYVTNATLFGVPQRRRRLIVVAVRERTRDFPESLTDFLPTSFLDGALVTAGQALELANQVNPESDVLHRPRRTSTRVAQRLAAIPVRGSRFNLPESLQLPCHVKLTRREATSAYSRVQEEAPAPTMTTRCTTPACGQFVHPTKARALTLREAATIQTFPLTYRFCGGPGSIEKQIGNAVPVRMAHGLALSVLQMIRPQPSKKI